MVSNIILITQIQNVLNPPPLLFPHSDFHYLYQVDEGVHPPNLDLGG